MEKRLKSDTSPSFMDPVWQARAEPTRVFLGKPQTWAALAKWAVTQKIKSSDVRNHLAYLETMGLIWSFYQGDTLYWAQTEFNAQENGRRPSRVKGARLDTSSEARPRLPVRAVVAEEPDQDR